MNGDSPTTLSKDSETGQPWEWTNAQMAEWCDIEADAWLATMQAKKSTMMRDIARRLRLLREKKR